jgi:hypothetical protein
MIQLRRFYKDESLCVSLWHNVLIMDVAGQLDLQGMRALLDGCRTLKSSYPSGIISFVMIREGTPLRSAESRKQTSGLTKELAEAILCSAIIIEDRGLLAQLIRGLVRATAVMIRNTRWTLAKDVDEGVRLLVPHVTVVPPRAQLAAEMLAVVKQARTAFEG